MTDHLAKAKDYIAIAESSDSKLAAYKQAADEIIKARKDDSQLGWREVGERLGKGKDWSQKLVQWRTSVEGPRHLPFGGEQENEARYERHAKTILKDPDRFGQVIPSLPTSALQQLADRADEAIVERREARRSEHRTGATGSQVSDFKPDEYWMDNVIIRLNRNAREAASLLQRGGGLLGAMSTEEAFEYLSESERLIAEVRVAFQARVRDEVQV